MGNGTPACTPPQPVSASAGNPMDLWSVSHYDIACIYAEGMSHATSFSVLHFALFNHLSLLTDVDIREKSSRAVQWQKCRTENVKKLCCASAIHLQTI